MTKTKQIYQIHISLVNSKPKIWRRILTSSNISLENFHEIIQVVMGWTNSHLHLFEDGDISYAPAELEVEDTENSRKVKLNSLLCFEKDKIKYEYDFGDGWVHNILLEKILPFDKNIELPSCIGGKRNCPPEDCGGIWGYEDLLAIISNPKHEEYDEMVEWLGEDFDPEYFDIGQINQMLKNRSF
jgi:hypothetical protein